MRKLRRLFSVLLACFICCSGFAVPSASASSDFQPFALPFNDLSVFTSATLYYGVDSFNRRMIPMGQVDYFPYWETSIGLGKYSLSSPSSSYYMYCPNSFYIDLLWTTDNYYMDTPQVDVILKQADAALKVKPDGNEYPVGVEPTSCVLLINGKAVGESQIYNPGTEYSITYDLSASNNTVSSYGVRYYFSPFNLKSSGSSSSVRYFYINSKSDITFNVHSASDISGIFSWLSSIKDAISGLGSTLVNIGDTLVNGFSNVVNAITSLPGLIIDGIKNLFIPSEDDLAALQTKYEDMLEQKLGFVWQAGVILTDFANSIISAFTSGGSYSFEFPGISVPLNGTTHVIVESQSVSLDNAYFDVIRPVLGTIVSVICVIGFVRIAEHMLMAVVSGASYFDFLTKRE